MNSKNGRQSVKDFAERVRECFHGSRSSTTFPDTTHSSQCCFLSTTRNPVVTCGAAANATTNL